MGDSNDMILVCDGPVKHCVTGRGQLGHPCVHRVAVTTEPDVNTTSVLSRMCGATLKRVKWNAALRAAARLGGAQAVEALLNRGAG